MKRTDPALRDAVIAAAIVNDTVRICGGDLGKIHAEIALQKANGWSHLEATKRATAPLWVRSRHGSRRDCGSRTRTPG